jgi:hypothetical protein
MLLGDEFIEPISEGLIGCRKATPAKRVDHDPEMKEPPDLLNHAKYFGTGVELSRLRTGMYIQGNFGSVSV